MSNNRITPFVKRLRTNGGTIYTFSSAIEDIGLNINERNNLVKISNFALLNIPNITESSIGYDNNTFNIRNIVGCWEYERNSTSVKDGRVLIAESFQNYALNLEANLLNQTTYNPELTATVSERVFWKWLKETGAIRWADPSIAGNQIKYWQEEIDSNNYTSVVKYVGQVSAGNVRMDTFGTYNETYVLVPTSHGQTKAYFKQIEDDNYHHGMMIGDLGENILGREGYTRPHPDALSMRAYYDFVDSSTQLSGGTEYYLKYDPSIGSWSPGWWYSTYNINPGETYTDNAYLTDVSTYLDSSIYHTDLYFDPIVGGNDIYFRRSNVDCINLEFNLDNLKTIFGDPTLTYDSMAINTNYVVNDSFDFNAVLVYYSVYNSTQDEILATNLLGIMFLDAPSGNSSHIVTSGVGIQLPSLEKIMSGVTGFGTSYSLRINIKTDNMLDDTTAVIVDQATSDQLWAEEWQQAFANLNIAVNTLTQQNATFNYISAQYITLQSNQNQMENQINALQWQLNDIGRDIQGNTGTVPLFSDGDDPLIESSIYMSHGKIGIFETNPQYAVHIDGSIKTLDITIENAIRDTSGNIILGYGSPLQLGSSTNYREVEIFTGYPDPAIRIDASNNINLSGDVSIFKNLQVDGSTHFKGSVVFDTSIYSPSFVSKVDVDSSFALYDGLIQALDDSIGPLNTLTQNNETSIGWLQYYNAIQDACIANDTTFGYVDGSLVARDTLIQNIDASLDLYVVKSGDTMTGDLTVDTSIILDGIILKDGIRSGLLQVNRKGATSNTGIELKFSPTAYWSILASETSCGFYDDYNNKYFWQCSEGKGITLWYNGGIKLSTVDSGVDINGSVYIADYQFMGDPCTNGSWRFSKDVSENLRFEKLVGDVWTYKYAIT